ncbi:MAG: AbrB/MazE/SpoVT family DNA-binding domain-containing protein [Deltaproteobacteria bacterium]|nr:AbrB/MazE/SpoVT family DNA-binding domain-containing protein [Deltaproteobacteria bacterium]
MRIRIDSRNRISLPETALDAIGSAKSVDVRVEGGRIILTPATLQPADAVRSRLAELNLTEQDVADAIAVARKKVGTE